MAHQIPDQHMEAVAQAMTTIFQAHQLSMGERAAMVEAMNIHFQHHQAAVSQGEPTYESGLAKWEANMSEEEKKKWDAIGDDDEVEVVFSITE
jgi:hypothetical protein